MCIAQSDSVNKEREREGTLPSLPQTYSQKCGQIGANTIACTCARVSDPSSPNMVHLSLEQVQMRQVPAHLDEAEDEVAVHKRVASDGRAVVVPRRLQVEEAGPQRLLEQRPGGGQLEKGLRNITRYFRSVRTFRSSGRKE